MQDSIAELDDNIESLAGIIKGDDRNPIGLEAIVLGSDRLNVRPMRDIISEHGQAYDRLRWVCGVIGVIVIALAVTWLNSLIGG